MGFFRVSHRWGGPKRPSLPKTCHTYPTMMKLGTVIPYLKKIWKTYKSRDTPLAFCWHQYFVTENQQISLYQEIQILIAFWYITSNSFNFSWIFKDCFNKHGYNFENVCKNDYPKSSWNKGFLKYRLWRHNLCPWRHQQNYITWFKLYCRCGHVTKVL